MTILISPYSQKMRNGKENPKNYPFWPDLVTSLKEAGHYLIQIGTSAEILLDTQEARIDCSLEELKNLVAECDIWIAVDNFLPHLCHGIKPGIVLWSKSDPQVFGYPENTNLFIDKKNFRKDQFDIWEKEMHSSDIFVSPDIIIRALDASVFKL